jgi:solute:Na+ symporter, SSS family
MRLSTFDILVLLVYFVVMIGIGVYVTRRAAKNLDSYFLGDKTMPWWLLGVSNASAMWDITGTMWLVAILYMYGMNAIVLPWLWPVFNQVFDAVYVSKWIRRSKARTGAEWITTRFGAGRGGELARSVIVLFALVSVTCFIAYDFQGMGKFCKVFLPWDLSPNTYAVLIMGITAIYVVLGGMLSVVLTDFVQFILMAISGVVIAVIAMTAVTPEMMAQAAPSGWAELGRGMTLGLDWSGILPAMNDQIAKDGMATMFGLFFTVMVLKGILVSMAGAAPNYDMQRILAAKSPKEASLMSAIVSICLLPRWFMIGGITLIGLAFITPEFRRLGGDIDFELVLPYVINNFMPAGFLGLLLAGLLSAFMSTFSATVNAGAAYLVNDVYARYLNPTASTRTLIKASYLGSVLVLLLGITLGFFLSSINQITQFIVNGLFGGYTAANMLKWYWWRLNGHGYFWGMLVGIVSAIAFAVFVPSLHSLYAFPFILALSLVASIAASLLTEPVESETLTSFYKNVRPWGFWGPVHAKVVKEDAGFQTFANPVRDLTNCGVGIIWQLTLVTIPLYVVFRNVWGTVVSVVVLAVTTIFLKKFWYDPLNAEEAAIEASPDPILSTGRPAEQEA